MKKLCVLLSIFCILFSFNSGAKAITLDGQRINFDDIPIGPGVTDLLPDNYRGFNWSSFIVYSFYPTLNQGYLDGILSGQNAVYNLTMNSSTIKKTDGGLFSFTEIWVTSVQNNDDLQVYVEGRVENQAVFSDFIPINTTGPTYRNYIGTPFENIDELYFIGVTKSNFWWDDQFVIDSPDSFVIPTPECSSMIIGFIGLTGVLKRRGKKSA